MNISGLIVPGIIRSKSMTTYCIDTGNGDCNDNFQYLNKSEEFTYKWIDSSYGADEEYSVYMTNIFGTFAIGRVQQNQKINLGLVYPGHGLGIHQNSNNLNKSNRRHEILYNYLIQNYYQILVRSSDDEEVTEDPTTPTDIPTTTKPPQNCGKI